MKRNLSICYLFTLKMIILFHKGPVIRATFFVQLVAQQCCVASWDGLLRVLPPSCATNFCVAKSRRRFYFLQHENLLRKEVVIRATNHLNLQRNIVARQVARKMLPVLLGLKVPLWPKNQFIFFFGFQNYVNKTLSDPRFKPWFQKDTSLF